jgi:hypothetical protein
MKQITVRRVQDLCVAEAKRLARERGVAVNTVFVEALEKGLGVGPEKTTNGLERFSGDSDFGPGWDAHLEALNLIHPADWE